MNGFTKGIASKVIAVVIGAGILVTGLGLGPALASGHDAPAHRRLEHGLGAMLPKKQVNAKLPRLQSSLASLPASMDLSMYDVPVGNQGSVGSCVTWAIDYAMLGWYANRYGVGQTFNPMYTFSQIWRTNADGSLGSLATDALSYTAAQGNDTMQHYSHGTTDYLDKPNASEKANAANYKVTLSQNSVFPYTGGVAGSNGAALIEQALAGGQPVAIGMHVSYDFVNNMTASASALWDNITSPITGNHEVLAVGYDQSGVVIQNSWGTGWGSGGYARLSWNFIANEVYEANTINGFATSQPTTDTTAPTMGAVNEQFALKQQVTSTTVPVTFNWSASDASGIAAYAVYVQTDGGAYVQDTTVTGTTASHTYALSIGHSYRIAVTAKDSAGNWSGYAYSVTVTPGAKDDLAYTLAGSWARYNLADTFAGTYTASNKAGASFQYNFTGRDSGLVSPKFNTAGRATLYCDGTSYGLVDTYNASTVGRQVVAWCHFPQVGQHTMKVVVEGTVGRPWFGVDAFTVLA